jgi:DNA-binding PadR family transcriptional regulator
MPSEDLLTNLPLTETTFFILLSLASSQKHGYAIAKDVENLSDNRIIFSTSTLYTALKRLLENGWIRRAGEDPEPDESGRPRKTYTLTDHGRRILEAEAVRLESLVSAAKLRSVGDGA